MTLTASALVLAACVPQGAATNGPSSPSASSAPSATASASVAPSGDASASVAPPSDQPTPEPTPPASASTSPSASSGPVPTPGPATACTGTADNQDFYARAAAAFDWQVYCPVLPAGWFVVDGSFRQAGGGRLEIAYRGPGGARLELSQGGFCSEADGCVPPGTDAGEAPFADQTGTVVQLDEGGWAMVVDRGEPISWLMVGTGLGETGIKDVARTLAIVEG